MNNKKNLIWVVIILIILVVGAYFLFFQKNDEFVVRDKDSFTSQQDVLDYFEQYKQAQSKDTYGGKTPEETLSLFVDALKKGDTKLASKYFILDKQDEAKKELDAGVESGGVNKFLEFYSFDKKNITKMGILNLYEIEYLDENGNGPGFVFRVKFVEESNIWKIESL